MAVAIWGKVWRGKTVRCVCDNAAVVAIVNSGRSRNDLVMAPNEVLIFLLGSLQRLSFRRPSPGQREYCS